MWYKLKRIMMRPNGVEKQVRPKWEWQPWVNTLAYFPLVNDILDSVWSTSITYDITPVQQSIWYRFSANNNPAGNTITISGANFYSWWIKFNSKNSVNVLFLWAKEWYIWFQFHHAEQKLNNRFFIFYTSSLQAVVSQYTGINIGNWHHICYGNDNGTWNFYLDWNLFFSTTRSPYSSSNKILLYGSWNSADTADISNIILESVCRTAQEIQDYYNLTKWDYWIS